MPKVFISYRRKDSAYVSSAIYRKLSDTYGKNNVFKDVDSIPLGIDYKGYIEHQIHQVELLLVVIGDRWLTLTNQEGARRIDLEDDLVRLEIEFALNRQIPVIPLFVNDADVPKSSDLPPSISSLVSRNGMHVRPDPDFDRDMQRLLSSIEDSIDRYHQIHNSSMQTENSLSTFATNSMEFFAGLIPDFSGNSVTSNQYLSTTEDYPTTFNTSDVGDETEIEHRQQHGQSQAIGLTNSIDDIENLNNILEQASHTQFETSSISDSSVGDSIAEHNYNVSGDATLLNQPVKDGDIPETDLFELLDKDPFTVDEGEQSHVDEKQGDFSVWDLFSFGKK